MDWQFDQPERLKMTPVLREQLGEGERLNISFTNVDCLTLSEKDEEDDAKVSPKIHMILPPHYSYFHLYLYIFVFEVKVPRKIHMVWIGSPLPEKLWKGPASFLFLNPGEW